MTTQPTPANPPQVPGPGDRLYDAWWSEVQYFFSVRERLHNDPDLRSKYVAIYHHEVIAVHTDQFELSRKMGKLHPGEVVLVTKVELETRRVELPSLEVRR